ncbi:uncharacterized protein BKA78DRAFT_299101 [Phyllosticta capitalensis]|uniref:uncharacterized protein n=1 Tax=Phyllosticta capitalensis TaxID=121624 RepID=UPI00312F0471
MTKRAKGMIAVRVNGHFVPVARTRLDNDLDLLEGAPQLSCALDSNRRRQLHVWLLNGDAFGVDRAEIDVLKEADEECLGRFVYCLEGSRLSAQRRARGIIWSVISRMTPVDASGSAGNARELPASSSIEQEISLPTEPTEGTEEGSADRKDSRRATAVANLHALSQECARCVQRRARSVGTHLRSHKEE